MRDHRKLRAFELADEVVLLTYSGHELKIVEAEKVLGALIRSFRSPDNLKSKQPTV